MQVAGMFFVQQPLATVSTRIEAPPASTQTISLETEETPRFKYQLLNMLHWNQQRDQTGILLQTPLTDRSWTAMFSNWSMPS